MEPVLVGLTGPGRRDSGTANEIDVGRYTRLLRDASAEDIERMHLDAFGKLTPAQLDFVFAQLSSNASAPDEQPVDARPASLAKAAAVTGRRRPGTLARILDDRYNATPAGTPVVGVVVGYIIAAEIVSPSFWSDAGAATHATGPTDITGGGDLFF